MKHLGTLFFIAFKIRALIDIFANKRKISRGKFMIEHSRSHTHVHTHTHAHTQRITTHNKNNLRAQSLSYRLKTMFPTMRYVAYIDTISREEGEEEEEKEEEEKRKYVSDDLG